MGEKRGAKGDTQAVGSLGCEGRPQRPAGERLGAVGVAGDTITVILRIKLFDGSADDDGDDNDDKDDDDTTMTL